MSRRQSLENVARRMRHDLLQAPSTARLLMDRLKRETDEQSRQDIIAAVSAALLDIETKLDSLTYHVVFEGGIREAEPTRTDLVLLTQDIRDDLDRSTPDIEVRFGADLDGTSGVLHTDAALLRLVILGVFTNACDFTIEGEVSCALSRARDAYVWTITDEGPGCQADWVAAAGTPFMADVGLPSRRVARLGLGLSNAVAAAKLLGAEISFRPRGDKIGTVATIRLPAQDFQPDP